MGTLITLGLIATYAGGVWKFWNGFENTNFAKNSGNKIRLSLLWPALCVVSKPYRQNFSKALKGSRR
ncbi:MAG: hypothetical protein HC825_05170 [Oscillatoriales cyanobacterium RM1_1_9]|nr:hypothetical protein [Oscillatoriales cyanobacterium SM2_3_0]NJO45486.1 hypothetical protein [Oscillatoriales cyanobacterium RM2_1_1]NJO71239.1 hypothetical protein [Oscillatoriales cyanobacterium RM1_1_9]